VLAPSYDAVLRTLQAKHTVTGYLQAKKDLHVASNFNFCTTGVTLCLNHTSNHNMIPLKGSHVIVANLVTRTIEQLRLLVRSSDRLRYERKLHGIEDLHKAHRSLHPRGILTSLEVLSLFPNCSVTDVDTDLQQQKLQGDAFKKEMTSKCHRHLIRQAGSWHFSRKDIKMVGSTTSRQCLQQGKVAKQLRSRQHRQSRGRISPDAPHLPFTWIVAAKKQTIGSNQYHHTKLPAPQSP
jgi:hypothetical protein